MQLKCNPYEGLTLHMAKFVFQKKQNEFFFIVYLFPYNLFKVLGKKSLIHSFPKEYNRK